MIDFRIIKSRFSPGLSIVHFVYHKAWKISMIIQYLNKLAQQVHENSPSASQVFTESLGLGVLVRFLHHYGLQVILVLNDVAFPFCHSLLLANPDLISNLKNKKVYDFDNTKKVILSIKKQFCFMQNQKSFANMADYSSKYLAKKVTIQVKFVTLLYEQKWSKSTIFFQTRKVDHAL